MSYRKILLALSLSLSCTAQAAICPDYQTPQQAPTAPLPAKKSFKHFGNTILAGIYSPWHMVHDSLVAEGQYPYLVGKFDYDALLHKDLEDERVHVYLFGTGMQNWEYLGSRITDSDGKIAMTLQPRPAGDYRVRMVVEGDRSSVDGWLTVVERGRQAVLFDVDGTLTINDFEAYADYVGVKTATPYYYAPQTVRAYQDKGYQILYLTARPYWVTRDGREWFGKQNLPAWHYRSNPYGDGPIPPNTVEHKASYVRYLRDTVGLNIIRAYGNATTDIEAYAAGGMPKADTWIIGEHAGKEGTQALSADYALHYSTVVNDTPLAACKR